MENLMMKNMARSLVLASIVTFSAVGVANAAGAGDQTGQHGDMSGHGGPIDKKAGSAGGQKSGPAPEPSTYRQSGGSTSGQTGGTTGGSADQGAGSTSTGSSGSGSTGSGSSGQTGGGGGY